ncbi:MAG TPA: DinB family protein [Bellilinea sp.]|nr:DinB family protein [Bellilinea sp.]
MGPLAQLKKNALIADILATRRDILTASADVPRALRDKIFLGSWSLLDLLAHLAGWDDANRQAVEAIRGGQLPAFYEYAERNWTTFNAKLVSEYRLDDFDALLERVCTTQQNLIEVLNTVPPEDFDRDYQVRFKKYKVTISRLLRAELKDEKVHLSQIRQISLLTPKSTAEA